MVAADVKGEICVVIDNSGTTDLYTEETDINNSYGCGTIMHPV